MRDELQRVGRPRKGAQKKPKDRTESRYRPSAAQGSYAFKNEEEFQIPNSKGPGSPMNMLTSPTSISSAALSVDSISSELNQFVENDSENASQDTLCAFCNCGSEMAQILGQINRYFPSPDFNPFSYEDQSGASHSMDISVDKYFEDSRDSTDQVGEGNYLLKPEKRSVGRPPGKKKKRSKQSLARHQHLSADMSTFGTPTQPEISDVFDADGSIWAHHCCAAWSAGVCQTDSYDLENVDKAAFKAISEQCSHCNRHGASVECQMQKCSKLYHYPCCASSGAFQDIKSMILLCPDHLEQASRLAGSEAFCVLCDKAGEISKQLFCTSCGRHYHGQCLDPPVTLSAIVRMGWQCPECKVCQGCR
eukprot:gene14865-5989_t